MELKRKVRQTNDSHLQMLHAMQCAMMLHDEYSFPCILHVWNNNEKTWAPFQFVYCCEMGGEQDIGLRNKNL